MEVAGQQRMLARDVEPLVHAAAAEAGRLATEEAHEPVGIPVAMPDPAAAVMDEPCELVAVRRAGRFGGGISLHPRDRRGKLGGNFLVGVDAEHPRMGRVIEREVFLADIAEPVLLHEPGTELVRDLRGRIGAVRIDNEDFVDQRRDARQAAGQVALLVQRDDAGGGFSF